MEFLTLKLKPLEPLMLRGPGEFDLSSRGVYSYASSLALPRPSTMIGTLVSVLLAGGEHVGECLDIGSWEDLLEKCYIRIFDKLSVESLRGPYIIRHDRLFTPIMFGGKIWLLDYYQAKHLLLEKYGDILEKLFSASPVDKGKIVAILRLIEGEIREHLKEYIVEPSHIDFTGIHLRSRELGEAGKIVKEGYIYTASYTFYPIDIEIVFLLVVRDSSKVLGYLPGRVAVKFGGEGKVAKMYVYHPNKDSTVLGTLLDVEKARYAILVSPMPLRNGDMVSAPFVGEYATIGYGFSLAKKRRKPVSPSIREGSIIKIDTDKRRLSREEALRYGLYSALGLAKDSYYRCVGRLGYASFMPLV